MDFREKRGFMTLRFRRASKVSRLKLHPQAFHPLYFILFVPAWVSSAAANEVPLFEPMNDVAILEPEDSPVGGPRFYSATGNNPRWNIAQWNIPAGKLSHFMQVKVDKNFSLISRSAEAEVRLTRDEDNLLAVHFSQEGSVLPCLDNGQPRESDLFVGPNDNVPGLDSGLTEHSKTLRLTEYKSLNLDVKLSVTFGYASRPKGCEINQAAAIAGIVLNSASNETMFYQISFARFCGHRQQDREALCSAAPLRTSTYSSQNPFGVDDYLPLSGQEYVKQGETRALNLDLLPRLKQAIEEGPLGLDRDLSHWHVNAFYMGQMIWGDVAAQTNWSKFRFTGTVQ
jgi:hypothetical protein